jgi:hypothetical protein
MLRVPILKAFVATPIFATPTSVNPASPDTTDRAAVQMSASDQFFQKTRQSSPP